MKKFSMIKKAAACLVMMIVIVRTSPANKKTNVVSNEEIITAGATTARENSVCNEYIPNDAISYECIYAGMPVVYNSY